MTFFIGVATLSFLKFKSEFSHLHDLDSHVKWDFENPLVFVILHPHLKGLKIRCFDL